MEVFGISETVVRLAVFVGVLSMLAAGEAAFPRRARRVSRGLRWPSNLAVSALNQLFVRLVIPMSAVGLALWMDANGWGLMPLLWLPAWIEVLAAVVLLDLTIYTQHLIYHKVPPLWRLHRMHHADVDFDVTTGIRFHPLSVLLSACIKLGAVALIGPAPIAVIIFEVLLNATSLFNHSNLRVPATLDRWLRRIVVTPDMHRVHHSADVREHSRNFGFNFPWWDRMFGTYLADPHGGHEQMTVGLDQFRGQAELRLDQMLTQPFRNDGNTTGESAARG